MEREGLSGLGGNMADLEKNYMVLSSPGMRIPLPGSNWHSFDHPSEVNLEGSGALFIVSQSSAINSVIEFVKLALSKRKFAGLFLRPDSIPPELSFKELASSLNAQNLQKVMSLTITAKDNKVLKRVLLAHDENRVDQRIANAYVSGAHLHIVGCNSKMFKVSKADVPVLSSLTDSELKAFKIHPRGERLHWPDHDIHLNLEGLLRYVDPTVQLKAKQESEAYAQKFGSAIRSVRKKYGLKQKDIGSPGEREVRRIEKGEVVPHKNTLAALAKSRIALLISCK